MQGLVTENGRYVKAAIIKFYEIQDSDADNFDTETVTYAETDDEGRFVLLDLDPEASYRIEIFVERQENDSEKSEDVSIHEDEVIPINAAEILETVEEILNPLSAVAVEKPPEESKIVDGIPSFSVANSTMSENIAVNNLYNYAGLNMKNKPYLKKINLW